MGMFDFLKRKEKVVEAPKVVETPKITIEEPVKVEEPKAVVFSPEEANEVLKAVEPVVKKTKATKAKTFKVPIDPLLDKCNKAIEREVAKDHHAEAKEIMLLATEDVRKEFVMYYEQDKGNICCLVLDKAKRDLIAEGKLVHKPEDAFGHPFML